MFEGQPDILERVVRHLRRPMSIDPSFDRRVMQAIAARPADAPGERRRGARVWAWLGLAAAIAALLLTRPWISHSGAGEPQRFVLVAPRAASVALVGDFNDWDPARTPMEATGAGTRRVWTAVLPLPPGRYRYAFLVDGAYWRADPRAPGTIDDGFGAPSSVVTVGGGT